MCKFYFSEGRILNFCTIFLLSAPRRGNGRGEGKRCSENLKCTRNFSFLIFYTTLYTNVNVEILCINFLNDLPLIEPI